MKDLKNINIWKQSFGLLPIHLYPDHEAQNSFIMLNGGHGDFCLNTEITDDLKEDLDSQAWSSNTNNFVILGEEKVKIFNWQRDKTEVILRSKVEENFELFYKYLLQSSIKTGKDVVPYIIDIFKQFRNLTQEKTNATEALNLLFALLISLEEDVTSLDFKKWGLSEVNIPSNFESYVDKLKNGLPKIKPRFDLIVRHSSGSLFQEAQKEVIFFDRQVDLWGAFSNKLNSNKTLFSSIHYTPPYLSRTIVENALRELNIQDKNQIKIFDPACGSSEFLIEALKQLREYGYTGNIKVVGWDNSQTAVNTSNFLLSYEKRTIWKDKLEFEIKLVNDSLQEEWSNDYDLLLMNPPFASWDQMSKESRNAVSEILSFSKIGRANQASAFFFKSIQCLNDNGVIGCVIPSSFLTLDSYNKLRTNVQELISINLIGKLGNFVFEDALTDVSLIVGRKPKSNIIPYILWTKNEKGIVQNALRDLRKMNYTQSHKVIESDYSIYQPSGFPITKENWKTVSYQDNELLKKIDRLYIESKLVNLNDVFSVQQGIRTGYNDVFKISEFEFNELPSSEKSYFRPVIDNDTIQSGQVIKSKYVWYPYNQKGLTIKSEEELISKVPEYYNNKLLQAKDILIPRALKSKINWWQLNRHRTWLAKSEPRLISTEFGNSKSFAFDKRGEFAVERGYAWIPKKDFKEMDSYYFYLSLFSSPFFDKLLSVYSRQLAGGLWYDLGSKHTKDIPIPNAHSDDVRISTAYGQLSEIGADLSEGKYYLRNMIDGIVRKYIYPEI